MSSVALGELGDTSSVLSPEVGSVLVGEPVFQRPSQAKPKPKSNPRSRPVIIDIEASGFGPHSYPIEIGVVFSNSEKYCSLVKPMPSWHHWDDGAEEVHGITREMINCAGRSPLEIALQLNGLLVGARAYSDGWVVDQPWLNRLFHAAGIRQTFQFSPLEAILTEPQMLIWHQTKDEVMLDLGVERHRASNDAVVIQETYMRSLQCCELQ